MKNVKVVAQAIAALSITAACAMPAFAQNTAPADTATTTANGTTLTTQRVEDDDRDFGWIGLLGLAGLLGLRRKTDDHHRPVQNRT